MFTNRTTINLRNFGNRSFSCGITRQGSYTLMRQRRALRSLAENSACSLV